MKLQDIIKDEAMLETYLNNLANVNEKINALVTIDSLENVKAQLADDESLPLYRVPVILKDNFSTKDLKTTASSKILDNYVPVYDATVTIKLKEAGALIVAKAAMDELGMGGTGLNAYSGPVINPYDKTRITGGSSSGSAASG